VAPYIVYDEAAKRTVVIGDTRLAAYDAAADRWEILAEVEPGGLLAGPMVFDPVNERLVGWSRRVGIKDQGNFVKGDGVASFDLATREWTVLLEPSVGQPAPGSR